MSQTSLIEKIKQDAAEAVAQIESAAAAEIETIVRDAEAVASAKKAENETAVQKAVNHAALVAVSKAKQNGNIAYQAAKRSHIDALFTELEAEFSKLTADEYVAFVTELAKEVVPEKVSATAVTAPKGREAETAKVLKKLHIDAPVTESKMVAGIVVHAKDGVYDASLDRLLSERRPTLEIELMKLINL